MTIEIANRLVQLRKQKNLSQEELAAQLGISRQAVSKWERAEASPDTDNLILLARLYGVSLDKRLNIDGEDSQEAEDPFFSEPPRAPEPPDPEWCAGMEGSAPASEEPQKIRLGRGAVMGLALCLAGIAALIFLILFQLFTPLFCVGLLLVCGFLKKRIPKLAAAYPLLCTMAFLLLGFCFGQWHPGWMLFLTIPLFYTLF